jgi:hypothetical protein
VAVLGCCSEGSEAPFGKVRTLLSESCRLLLGSTLGSLRTEGGWRGWARRLGPVKWREGMPYGLGFVAAFLLDVFFDLRWWQRIGIYAIVGAGFALVYQLALWLRERSGRKWTD